MVTSNRTPTIFSPGIVPNEVAQLQRYITDLEIRIQNAFSENWIIPMSFKPPERLIDGLIAYADGTFWNPGGGRGIYRYDVETATWVQLG